jgi:hypothetical protein
MLASQVVEWKEDIQKSMVPAQPVMDCILIRLWVFLFGESTQARILGGPISIPMVVSKRPSSKTPLVDTMVRRSPRINPTTVDGYQMVKIREPVSKRRKKVVLQIDLDNPPTDASEMVNPIPLETIREWGAACGVSLEELSDDVLMQGHDDDQI